MGRLDSTGTSNVLNDPRYNFTPRFPLSEVLPVPGIINLVEIMEIDMEEFRLAVKPLQDYLRENHHSGTQVVVTYNTAELTQKPLRITTGKNVRKSLLRRWGLK